MPWVRDGSEQAVSLLSAIYIVPALRFPIFDNVPVRGKFKMIVRFLNLTTFQFGNSQQFFQIVRVACVRCLPIRKIMPVRSPGNAGFEGALDHIAAQVVSAMIMPAVQKSPRFAQPRSRDRLQLFSVHAKDNSSYRCDTAAAASQRTEALRMRSTASVRFSSEFA
jgi:hypothetical protein